MMTIPPEIIKKAERALERRSRCYKDGRPSIAQTVIAEVYDDIVADVRQLALDPDDATVILRMGRELHALRERAERAEAERDTRASGLERQVAALRSDYLHALSQLEGIDNLLAAADRLSSDGRTGWATTSAVRLAGGLP